MFKRKSKVLLGFFLGLLVLLMIVYKFTLYSPPFLDNSKRNFAEKLIDFFFFGWYFTKASIYEEYLKNTLIANKEFGKAGWYRKIYLERKFKLESLSLYSILDVYKKLNTESILEKLYVYQLENNKTNEITFLQEAGEMLIICGNWKMATVAFQRIIDSNQSDTMDNYFLGLSYFNLNKLVQAKFYLQKVIDSNPDFSDAYYRFGLMAEKREDWEEAKKYYKKAINILPNHIECLKSLHNIYEKRD